MNALLLAIIVATASNEAGGKIALTDLQGVCPENQFTVISFAPSGRTIEGCWVYTDGLVLVKWSDGELRTFEADKFTIKEGVE